MLFRDINFYLDEAKKSRSLSSDRKLGEALGYKGAMISFMRKGKSFPSPDKMVEIADMAGIDEETALIDLGIWSTRGRAQEVYSNMLQKLSRTTAAIAILGSSLLYSTPSHATHTVSEITNQSVNITNSNLYIITFFL